MQSSRSFLALQIVAILTMIACSAAIADEKRDAQIAKATEALREKLVATRRDVHEHPELSNREERTSQLVAERLRALGFDEVKTGIAKHGVVALVKGGKPGPVVAYRADMDALPITESNNVPYKSHSPGVMHACGHDAHTAIGLGVAEVLSKMRDQIPGSVKFLFQPAEEGAPAGEEGGAVFMIKEGALENPKPAAIFAMHVSPGLSVGTIGYRSGPAQCSIDTFTITIRGKVPFAGTPEAGVDSIVVAAQCVTALQTIKSRRLNSFEPIVLTIGSVHGGKGPFNTPEEVKLDGCLRTFSEDIRKQTLKLIRETLTGTTEAYGAKFDFENRSVTAVVVNNPDLVAGALPALRRTVGETNLVEMPKWMGGEDFSYYGQIVPGFLFRLGVGNKTKGITSDIHTPTFNIDEDSLSIGVKAMSMVLLDYLHQHAGAVPPR
jgi:amidohydrolase